LTFGVAATIRREESVYVTAGAGSEDPAYTTIEMRVDLS